MVGHHMYQVVPVHVRVHGHALQVELLVVGRAGQRRQDEKLQHVYGQLALNDLDVPMDRLARIRREAQDVSGIGGHTLGLPGL